jgi:alpha-beta hydrolase superfamily lysophospholipase
MTADLKQLADIIRAEHAGLPLIVFSHSMGSAFDPGSY